MTVAEAKAAHLAEFIRSVRESNWYGPVEADDDLNDSCRELVTAIAESGPVMLGIINGRKERGVPWCWLWESSNELYNFGADFVIPGRGHSKLRRMLQAREDGPYTGTKDDGVEIDAIIDYIEAAGGHLLTWS